MIDLQLTGRCLIRWVSTHLKLIIMSLQPTKTYFLWVIWKSEILKTFTVNDQWKHFFVTLHNIEAQRISILSARVLQNQQFKPMFVLNRMEMKKTFQSILTFDTIYKEKKSSIKFKNSKSSNTYCSYQKIQFRLPKHKIPLSIPVLKRLLLFICNAMC